MTVYLRSITCQLSLAVALVMCMRTPARTQSAPADQDAKATPAEQQSMHVPPHPKQTPGVTLLLEEIRPGAAFYMLRTSGFPHNHKYTLRLRVSTHPDTFAWMKDVTANADGQLQQSKSDGKLLNLNSTAFHISNEPGVSTELIALSDDASVMAYDKVFPVPLEAHDGSCSVFAEVLDEKRNTFGLLLFGFRPGEQVRAKSEQAPTEAACGLISEALSINRDGRYSLKIVHCGPPASSVFSVSAADCQVTLTYDYGLRPETTR